MGVKENKHLKLVHADGLEFMRPDFSSRALNSSQAYDVIILDVAVPGKVLHLASPISNGWNAAF